MKAIVWIMDVIHKFIRLEKEFLLDFYSCFWKKMNIIGKIVFCPVLICGLIIMVVILPFTWVLVTICTYKPKKSNNYDDDQHDDDQHIGDILVLVNALKVIATTSIHCIGPGCPFCEEGDDGLKHHPPSGDAKLARNALMQAGLSDVFI